VKLVIAGGYPEQQLKALRAEFPTVNFVHAPTPADVLREVPDADALYGWGAVNHEVLAVAKKLKWVHGPAAGAEWIRSVPEIIDMPIQVTNGRGAFAATIAESAFGMLLYLTRNLGIYAENQKKHAWAPAQRAAHVGLSGLTLGVLGLGKIGTAIADRGQAFQMEVIGCDAHDVARPSYVKRFWLLDGLNEFLKSSDVVMVTVPITPESRGMISATRLALMKKCSYLIVVSRGGIVDEAALPGFLHSGHLAGCGLDATDPEPLPADSPLWDAPHTIITPHTSGWSTQTSAAVVEVFKENLRRFIAGQPLFTPVNKKLGY